MTDWEGFGSVFEGDDSLFSWPKFGNVGMLLELQIRPAEICGRRSEVDLDVGIRGVGDLQVHVALEFHGLNTTVTEY